MKTYNYIYLITNNLNGKIYIGKHSTDDLDDGYMGSGTLLQNAKNKYGIENFSKEYLFFTDNKDSLNYFEKFYIKKYKAQNRNIGYNISPGGDGGGIATYGFLGKKHSEEYKQKMKEISTGNHNGLGYKWTEEQKEHLHKALEGRPAWNKGIHGYYKHSEESKMKNRETHLGKKLSEEHKHKISCAKKGKHVSEETKQKMSEAKKQYWKNKKKNIIKI